MTAFNACRCLNQSVTGWILLIYTNKWLIFDCSSYGTVRYTWSLIYCFYERIQVRVTGGKSLSEHVLTKEQGKKNYPERLCPLYLYAVHD